MGKRQSCGQLDSNNWDNLFFLRPKQKQRCLNSQVLTLGNDQFDRIEKLKCFWLIKKTLQNLYMEPPSLPRLIIWFETLSMIETDIANFATWYQMGQLVKSNLYFPKSSLGNRWKYIHLWFDHRAAPPFSLSFLFSFSFFLFFFFFSQGRSPLLSFLHYFSHSWLLCPRPGHRRQNVGMRVVSEFAHPVVPDHILQISFTFQIISCKYLLVPDHILQISFIFHNISFISCWVASSAQWRVFSWMLWRIFPQSTQFVRCGITWKISESVQASKFADPAKVSDVTFQ